MQTISEQQLLATNQRDPSRVRGVSKQHILVALSGGADSTALLQALWRLRNRLKLRLSALYVNHGLRLAAELRREELHCQRLCAKMGVAFYLERVKVREYANQRKISLETAGRLIRYELLQGYAEKIQAHHIATGHHQNDQIETVLFRLLRGGWLDSLAGIPYQRGVIIRPLLDCTKAEIVEFLRSEKVRFLTDSTNKNPAFSRNRIRTEILPRLRKQTPSIDRALLDYSRQARAMSCVIQREVERFLNRHSFLTPGGKLLVDRQQFTRLPADMSTYVVREGIQKLTPHFSTISPDQAKAAVDVSHGRFESANLPDGMTVRIGIWSGFKVEDLLVIAPKPIRLQDRIINSLPSGKHSMALFSGRARMNFSTSRTLTIPDDHYAIRIDSSKVSFPIVIRPWVAGDRFIPLGMRGNKKVGDILTDRKYPSFLRDEQLVVADQSGIIWVVGQTIADRVKLTSSTKRSILMKFEIREDCL